MSTRPTKPTAPAQALRSDPRTFTERAEASMTYQFNALPTWMEGLATYMESQANASAAGYRPASLTTVASDGTYYPVVRSQDGSTVHVSSKAAILTGLAFQREAHHLGAWCFVDGSSTLKPGWLPANGAAVSRTTYAEYFALVGTDYGQGNGTTTFNLPDLGGRTLIGENSTYANRSKGGASTHTLTEAQIPAHRHQSVFVGSQTSPIGSNVSVASSTNYGTDFTYAMAGNRAEANGGRTSPVGGGQAHNNMQPYLTQKAIVFVGA